MPFLKTRHCAQANFLASSAPVVQPVSCSSKCAKRPGKQICPDYRGFMEVLEVPQITAPAKLPALILADPRVAHLKVCDVALRGRC